MFDNQWRKPEVDHRQFRALKETQNQNWGQRREKKQRVRVLISISSIAYKSLSVLPRMRGLRNGSMVKMLLQRALVQFPAPASGIPQPFVTPVPEGSRPLASVGTSTQGHITTHIHII